MRQAFQRSKRSRIDTDRSRIFVIRTFPILYLKESSEHLAEQLFDQRKEKKTSDRAQLARRFAQTTKRPGH